jgi:hypothetical protein
MNTFLLATLLVAGSPEAGNDVTPKVGGKWLIVYAEEGGRRNNAWEQQQATVDGSKLSYEVGGKQQTLELKFGPGQTLSATEGGEGKTGWSGVYVHSQDYFVISVNKAAAGEAKADDTKPKDSSSAEFILILRRQR